MEAEGELAEITLKSSVILILRTSHIVPVYIFQYQKNQYNDIFVNTTHEYTALKTQFCCFFLTGMIDLKQM